MHLSVQNNSTVTGQLLRASIKGQVIFLTHGAYSWGPGQEMTQSFNTPLSRMQTSCMFTS